MTLLRSSLAAVAASFALVAPAAPAVAATTVDLSRPAQLERGDDVRIPHLEGDVVVHGDRRIEVRNAIALMGTTGDDYVVQVKRPRGPSTIKRVAVTGEQWVLLRGTEAHHAELSGDGEYLLRNDNTARSVVTAYDTTDGTQVGSHPFRRFGYVVGSGDGLVYVSRWSPTQRLVAWDVEAGTTRTVVGQFAGLADARADRLLVYTGDPYEGGCAQVRVLSAPDSLLWESCSQRVASFSSDGAQMLTIGILTDGVGPSEVQLRETDGTRLARYRAHWFGAIGWEDADTLLLDANGARRGAVVRCDLDVCERAGELHSSTP